MLNPPEGAAAERLTGIVTVRLPDASVPVYVAAPNEAVMAAGAMLAIVKVDGVPLTEKAPPEPVLACPERRLIPAVSPLSGCAESVRALTRIVPRRTLAPPRIVSTGVVPPSPVQVTPAPWQLMA